ncbi:MAG TPA: VWA domain-containing protein [Acidobacteriaceae bacterium]|nr:VWA domain-containing protein [Acidobacteriaceae bacterium]
MATALPNRALCLLLLAASAALAQQPPGFPTSPPAQPVPSPDESVPTLKVTSRLTIENVTVTDAAGKPVHGLKQSDFTIKEDGKPQTIKNFQEFGVTISSAQSVPPALPPNVYTNAPPAVRSGAINILLLDTLNTGPARQSTVREKAIRYLKTMPSGTKIAIFEIASELHMVQGFTGDRAVLLAAMDSFTPTTIIAPQIPPSSLGSPCPVRPPVDAISFFLNSRSRATLDALDEIAALASQIKGRKNLIWFTTGLPQITAFTMIYDSLHKVEVDVCGPDRADWPPLVDYTSDLQRAYGLLTAAQVAIYPIDPRGLGGQAGDVGELPLLNAGEIRQYSSISMQDMAASTGGIAYYNRNDLDGAIGEAIANGADYYSLSYIPPSAKYNGKYHKIEVKLDRPGLQLEYREGYTDVDLAKPLPQKNDAKKGAAPPAPDSDFHAAIDRSMIPATELVFNLHVAPSTAPAKPGDPAALKEVLNPKLKDKPLIRYALTYEIPAGEVTLVDGPNGTRKGSLEFDAVAYGDDGTKLNAVRETVSFTLKPNEIEHFIKNPVEMPLQIDLPAGKVDIRAGVLDAPSQKMGTLEFPEEVSKEPTPSFSQDAALAPTSPPAFPQALSSTALQPALPEILPPATQAPALSQTPPASANTPLSEKADSNQQIALYGKARSYLDDSIPNLERRVPELKGLKADPDRLPSEASNQTLQNRSPLPRLLDELGANIAHISQTVPNLTANEEVTQQVSSVRPDSPDSMAPNPAAGPERNQTFHYLLLVRQTTEGRLLKEDRTDLHNQPPGKDSIAPVFWGMAGAWGIFLPNHRDESRFRYLGGQQIHGRKTLVVAFAQTPGSVHIPGQILAAGGTVPMLLQGVAWIDEATMQILQIRTDLLAPQPEVRISELEAKIRFGPVRIPKIDTPLWLPQEVDAHCEAHGNDIHEQHDYSKYHLFHTTVRMTVVNPAS